MKTRMATAFLTAILFVSCKKELQPQESAKTPVTDVAAPTPQNIEKQFEVQNQTQQTAPPVQTSVQTQVAPTAPGMNPPHGQPNHRCDIAVGAPLNSPKAAATTTAKPAAPVQQAPAQGQASINQVDMASGTTATKPGMNPPHGQEGHRCEIAVGAPLPK